MTESEAIHCVGLLAGGLSGFGEDAVEVYTDQIMKRADDFEAMSEVCEQIVATWKPVEHGGAFRPGLGEILDEYRNHPRVAAQREASTAAALARTVGATHCTGSGWVDVPDGDGLRKPCPRCNPYLAEVYADADKWARYRNGAALSDLHDGVNRGRDGAMKVESMSAPCKVDTRYDPERIVDFAEGMQIARDEYRSLYGREIGDSVVANPVYAADIIMRDGTFDPLREVWRATYSDVANGFNQDHARAIASLHGLGRRLTHDNSGKLTLRPPSEPAPALPAATDPPPPPSERPPDASGLLAEALGETRRRMEGER